MVSEIYFLSLLLFLTQKTFFRLRCWVRTTFLYILGFTELEAIFGCKLVVIITIIVSSSKHSVRHCSNALCLSHQRFCFSMPPLRVRCGTRFKLALYPFWCIGWLKFLCLCVLSFEYFNLCKTQNLYRNWDKHTFSKFRLIFSWVSSFRFSLNFFPLYWCFEERVSCLMIF